MTEVTKQNPLQTTTPRLTKREELALRGFRLPNKLQKVGIRVEAGVSIEHQQLSGLYVLRGKESGGATSEFGAYCSFVGEDGVPLNWSQKIDTIAVNQVHAIVIRESLVRVEVFRVEHTYDVLVTRHSLSASEQENRKPKLSNEILFHGRLGHLALDLWSRDKSLRGSVSPAFLTRSGEPLTPPEIFEETIRRAVAGACCIGCRRHTHVLIATQSRVPAEIVKGDREANQAGV